MKYLNRKLKSIMLSGLLSMGIVTANYAMFNKEVVLIVDGQEIEVNSYQPDVQGVLDENKIEYDSNYVISEDLNASLEDGMEIEVKQIEKVNSKPHTNRPKKTKREERMEEELKERNRTHKVNDYYRSKTKPEFPIIATVEGTRPVY